MYKKNFDKWNKVKKKLDKKPLKSVRRGEIRWAVLGINIGSESDGKGNNFTRPVLVIKVVSHRFVLMVPMFTKSSHVNKDIVLYWKFGPSYLALNQLRVISTKRILDRKGKISNNKLKVIKKAIRKFYSF
jgi:mRNA interferase MazF